VAASSVAALRESVVGWLAQDLPFFVLSTILLIRTLNRRDDPALLPSSRLCSAEYDGSYVLLILNTLKTAGMLATKLMKLEKLPTLWSKRQALQAETEKLARHVARLENVELAALAGTAPADDGASTDSLQDAAPSDDGAVAHSADPPAVLGDLVSVPLVSLSLRAAERGAWGPRWGVGGSHARGLLGPCRVRRADAARRFDVHMLMPPLCRNRPQLRSTMTPPSPSPSRRGVDLRQRSAHTTELDRMDDVQGPR
jgi:hypothetical protein